MAIGKFSKVWIDFARYYEIMGENERNEESEGQLENANIIY
mgnify:CR=1 FL=1